VNRRIAGLLGKDDRASTYLRRDPEHDGDSVGC
jgi:hypothetical protein